MLLRHFARGKMRFGSGQTGFNDAFARPVTIETPLETVEPAKTRAALDAYFAECVRCFRRSLPVPAWPVGLAIEPDVAATRITFHGIALLLVESSPELIGWPEEIAERVREEARLQRFWEQSHAQAIANLLDALDAADIKAVVIKGTALAYSLYPDPAIRRRGDSDILIRDASRAKTRAVLVDCGFWQRGDVRPLQESWQVETRSGFEHMVDIHWRINASSAIADLLEVDSETRTSVPLPRLSESARGIGPVANLILTCINRASHEAFGYIVGNEKMFECDRLIWALDIDLVSESLSPEQWDQLVAQAGQTGSSPFVHSALQFAQRTLGTAIPEQVIEQLAAQPGDERLIAYFSSGSASKRLKLDLAASHTLGDKARVLRASILPGADSLHERFPDAPNWPVSALRARRLISGVGKILRGKG